MRMIQILMFSCYLFSQQSIAVTQMELDSSRNNALAWLVQNQNGDGSWGDQTVLRIQTTSEALQVLARYGLQGSYATKAGQSWLTNQDVSSTDSLAHIIKSLAKVNADNTAQLNQLLSIRDTIAFNWGAYAGYRGSVIDTAVASEALKIANYNDSSAGYALGFIVSKQHADGSWAMNESLTRSSVLSTAQSIMTLSQYRTIYSLDGYINNALNWLHGQQKTDGGFAEDSVATTGQVFATAQVIRAIKQAQDSGNSTSLTATFQTDLDQARGFLVNAQHSSGEWQAGVLPTLAALQISPETTLADFDQDGVPDEVETILGTNVAVADSRQYAVGNGDSIDGVTTASTFINTTTDQAINTTLQANGGSGPYTWSIISGSLPDGVTLDTATGLLSGTAQQIGHFNFTYRVADASGWIKEKLIQINIDPLPSTQVPLMPSWMIILMGLTFTFIATFIRRLNSQKA